MVEKNFGHSCAWININSEEINDYSTIYQTYQIDKEMVEYALDENERAHIEYCRPKETLVVIYNVIKQTKRENRYETVPMTFIVRKDQIITISNRHNEYIVEAMRKELEDRPNMSLFTFLFSSLMMITENYFPKIESLKKEQELVSLKLRHKTTKKNLFALSDLEIGSVYLVSATKQNAIVLEQLKTQALFKALEFAEEEKLENSLNDTMKLLTIISILLTIPNIVTGFFGMNITVPLTGLAHGWGIVLGIIVTVIFIASVVLSRFIKK